MSFAAPVIAAGTGLDGTITNALTGAPVAGAAIVIQHPDGSGWNFANSDSAGHYDFPDASGNYLVQVRAGGYVDQSLNATAPGTADVALAPIQYGSVSGRAFKHGGGNVADVRVDLYRNLNPVASTSTDNNGRYVFNRVETGTYKMLFWFPSGQTIWYENAPDEFRASTFVVSPNATTVIDVTRPPVGNLFIKAVDKVTGTPIAGYCWYWQQGPQQFTTTCSDSGGQARLSDIQTGVYSGGGFDQNEIYVNGRFEPATVTEGNTTNVTVRLEKSVRVNVSFVDAVTGDPVNGSCVTLRAVDVSRPSTNATCGPRVEFKNLFAEFVFQMFVTPYDHVHGAQWVSTTGGGTGDLDLAKVYRPNPGDHITVVVRLDGAGSVTGVVRDAATGAEVGSVCPTPSRPPHYYTPSENADCTFGGTYFVRELGPYQWKLAFPSFGGQHAWTWSGNAANRASATPVQVVAGQTTTLDVALPATGTISGIVTGPPGSCLRCAQIMAVDAQTGDHAGIAPTVAANGTFTIRGLNTQRVWLYYNFGFEIIKYPTMLQTTAGGATTGVVITRP